MTIVSKQNSISRKDKGFWQRQIAIFNEKARDEYNEQRSSYYSGVAAGISKVVNGTSVY